VLVNLPKQLARGQRGSLEPVVEQCFNPAWHRYCSGMAALALQVDDRPVFLPLLDVTEIQIDRFVPPKSAGEQDCQECAITFALQLLRVRRIPELLRLLRR